MKRQEIDIMEKWWKIISIILLVGYPVFSQEPSDLLWEPLIDGNPVGRWGFENCISTTGTQPPYFDCDYVLERDGQSGDEVFLKVGPDGRITFLDALYHSITRERTGDGKALPGTHEFTLKVGLDKADGNPDFDENAIFISDKWTNNPSAPGVEENSLSNIRAGYMQIERTSTDPNFPASFTRVDAGNIITQAVTTDQLTVIDDTRVEGMITAVEGIVTPQIETAKWKISSFTGGPDFVFLPDYKLKPLDELEKHIEEHGHLPEIPSAEEMEKEGVDMVELNMKLLQKIEEMTLYIMDQEKRIQKLEMESE